MTTILSFALPFVISFVAVMFAFKLGYNWGFAAGKESELNKVAQRHERMKRFNTNGYDQ